MPETRPNVPPVLASNAWIKAVETESAIFYMSNRIWEDGGGEAPPRAARGMSESAKPARAPTWNEPMTRKKILLIDDDAAVIEFLVAKLGASCDVVSTLSPRDATRLAREQRPDLILCDIDMPGMDGGDLSVELFGDESIRGIPFVYLTAIASPKELGARGGHLGGRKAISKHLPPDELLARVRELLDT